MNKFLVIILLSFFCTNTSYATDKINAEKLIFKAQDCFNSLSSDAQEKVVQVWNKTATLWNEGVELDKKGDTTSKSLAKMNFINVQIWSKAVLKHAVLHGGSQDCILN